MFSSCILLVTSVTKSTLRCASLALPYCAATTRATLTVYDCSVISALAAYHVMTCCGVLLLDP
eukprot:IDg6986t1